jgi:hypothetical protein
MKVNKDVEKAALSLIGKKQSEYKSHTINQGHPK